MVACRNCSTENPAESRFCGNCGAPLAQDCSACGQENPAVNNFCANCGSSLVPGDPAPDAVPTNRESAERRFISVLFADLVGFTTFSETRDPEEVRAMLTRYFDRSREVIERFGGEIEKFIGDAVTAF